jgi:hypothetical protein
VPRGYVTTFYPNTIDASTAVPIDIPAASESKGMDVRMHRETAFSVRGTASGTAVAGARLIVNRLDAEGLDQSEAPVFVNVAPGGRFELHDLRPGPMSCRSLRTRPTQLIRRSAGGWNSR